MHGASGRDENGGFSAKQVQAVGMKTVDFRAKTVYPGVPEKSDRLFGERRSSGVIESPCKQICQDTGARDTELVTTTERSDP